MYFEEENNEYPTNIYEENHIPFYDQEVPNVQIDNDGVIWELLVYKESGNKTVLQYIQEIKKQKWKDIFVWISSVEPAKQKKEKKSTQDKSKDTQEKIDEKYEKLGKLNKIKKFFEHEIKGALIIKNKTWTYYDISIK